MGVIGAGSGSLLVPGSVLVLVPRPLLFGVASPL
jgi:hypothetical protein